MHFSLMCLHCTLRIALCLAVVASVSGCSPQPPAFLGKWVMPPSGSESHLVFNADGTGRMDANMFLATLDAPFTWKQEGDKLVVTVDILKPDKLPPTARPEDAKATFSWRWSVNGPSLTLTDGGTTEVYQWEGPAPN